MSLEEEAAGWRRNREEREVDSDYRAHRTEQRRRVVEEASYSDANDDDDGFVPIDIKGAKKIARFAWRVLDTGLSRLSKKMKLKPDEFAELVDDTAPVVQLYVPQPGGPGFSPWWVLGATVVTVYGAKLFSAEEKPPPPGEQTVDGQKVPLKETQRAAAA